MKLFMKKSFADLMQATTDRLKASSISEIGKGGVAKLLISIINENLYEFYNTLQVNHTNVLLSESTGDTLKAIGYMLSCTKLYNETDDEYRLRISQQVFTIASANELAIKLAILSLEDVQDVVMKPYTMGTGSFSAFVITKNAITSEASIESIKKAIAPVAGYGIKYTVSAAGYVPVEAKIKLMFSVTTDQATQQNIKTKVQDAIKSYFNSRAIGENLIINEITQKVMEVSDSILNYQLYDFKINGRVVLNKDQSCKWNERFIESPSLNSIIVL